MAAEGIRAASSIAAVVAAVALAPAAGFAQTPADYTVGARVCGPDQLREETASEYAERLEAEDATPGWIWLAIDTMEGGPGSMTFTLQEVNGVRVLHANGAIDDRSDANLRAALARYGPIEEVWLNSPGGNSRVGVQMGHTLREKGLITMVKAGHGCASACSTAFLGGLMRRVEAGAVYGVHMYSTEIDGTGPAVTQALFNDIQWQGAMGAAERIAYAQEMGATRKWASIWSGTPPGCMTFMSQSELSETLVNNLLD